MSKVNKKELLLESKAELIERARELDLPGRSKMSKEELAAEIAKALVRADAARARRGRKADENGGSKATPAKALRAIEERSRKNKAAAEAAEAAADAAAEAEAASEDGGAAPAGDRKVRPSRAGRRAELPAGTEQLDLEEGGSSVSSGTVVQQKPPYRPTRVPEDQLSGAPLPKRYGRDKFVLLTRDPRWLFAYWELTSETEKKIFRKIGADAEGGRKVLRVFDVTGKIDVEGDANDLFDLQIHPDASSWYIHLPTAGRAWRVELGILGRSGRFYRILGSATVKTPRKSVSNIVDEKFRTLDEEFDEIFKLSGGKLVDTHLAGFGGSAVGGRQKPPKAAERPEKYDWPFPTSGALSSWHGASPMSSGAVAGGPGGKKKAPKGDDFFFWVDCELILYGGTQPTAKVTVQGRPVKLRPDGTFTLRYALPDGRIELPSIAVRADGKEKRKIEPIVTRRTIR